MLRFWDNVRKYNGKKLIEIKLGFWDNARKYSGKKLLEIKIGFLDNVTKYNGKKLLEIKLGFWDMNAHCKPRFKIQYYRARIIHSTDVTYWFKRIWGMKKCLWQDNRWHWAW